VKQQTETTRNEIAPITGIKD